MVNNILGKLDIIARNFKKEQKLIFNVNQCKWWLDKLFVTLRERHGSQYRHFPLYDLFVYGNWEVNAQREIFLWTKQGPLILSPQNAVKKLERLYPREQLLEVSEHIERIVELLRDILLSSTEPGDLGIYKRYKQRIIGQRVILDDYNQFFFYDDNLFHMSNTLIHGKNYSKVFQWNPQTEPTFRELQAIIRLMKKSKEVRVVEYQSSLSTQALNGAIRFLERKNYTPIQKLCAEMIGKHSPKRILADANVFDKVIKELDKNKYVVPITVKEKISRMVDGNIELVDQLSKLLACSCLSIAVKPKLWVISTNCSREVLEFFRMVEFPNHIDAFNGLKINPKHVFKMDYFAKIIEKTYLGSKFVQVMPAESIAHLNDEYFRKLKKIILQKPLTLSFPAAGKLTYINRIQWITFISKESELRRYKEYLNDLVEIVTLPKLDSLVDDESANFNAGLWFSSIFAIYGLTNIVERKKANTSDDSYQFFDKFIEECCVLGDDEKCYKDELYEAYSLFLQNRYSMKPIPKGRFHNLISSKPNIQENRPRTNRGDNKRGYRGISVELKKAEADSPEIRKEKVVSYLEAINKKVLTLLDLDEAGGVEKQLNSEGGEEQ